MYKNQDFSKTIQDGVDKDQIISFFQQLNFGIEEKNKDMLISKSQVPNSKFLAVKCRITIKSNLLDVVQEDQRIRDLENSNGWKIFKYVFLNDEDKQKLINYKEQQPEKLQFLVHSIKDVPVIKLREVLCVRQIEYDKDKQIVNVYNQNVKYDEPLYPKSIISLNKTWKIYEQKQDQVEITQYQFVDPQGSVPSGLYNMMLVKMVGQLQDLKEKFENQQVEK